MGKNKKLCKRLLIGRLGLTPERNLRELIDKLAITLNEPYGLNMHISYETLMASNLKRLEELVELVNRGGEIVGK